MELQEFIKNAIIGVSKGVEDAKRELGDNISKTEVNPVINHVYPDKEFIQIDENKHVGVERLEFDIAITVESKKNSKGSIAVLASAIGVGGSKGREQNNSTVHRLKFNIPIKFA